MPVYEYACRQCRRRFKKLVGMVAQTKPLACPRCQSTDLAQLISRFARLRSEDEAFESLAEEMEGLEESDDPKAMRRLMRAMSQEMGEDLEDDFEAALDEEFGGSGGESGDEADAG
jgi:putative FmdB family regulatory protein